MSNQAEANIAKEQQNAMKATADENNKELRKEAEKIDDNSDDEVVVPQSKPVHSLDNAKLNSNNNNIKKEAPEMNIQLQR